MIDKKEIRKSLAKKHKQLADLQEEIADQESLLPEKQKTNLRAQNGFSPMYTDKFQDVLEQLSKAEITVMWEVKRCFDNHQARKSKNTEVNITTNSIHASLAANDKVMNQDTVRKALKKLVDIGFIKPMSESTQKGKRSSYRLNPFITAGTFSESLGKLQSEWKKLFL